MKAVAKLCLVQQWCKVQQCDSTFPSLKHF